MAPNRTKPPSQAELRTVAELAKRTLAERYFHEFIKQAWHVIESDIGFRDNWHIQAECEHLEAVADGRIKQIIFNVPPGTMKSLLVAVFWPAWVWIRNPGRRFMFSSYSETLSLRDSVRCRDLVLSEWYQERWPIDLKDDQNTKGRFDNEQGGWRIVGSITGKGIGEHPSFNIADDPHNVLQAESDADRQNVTRWFEGVFCVRGEVRDVGRILVMQRLHSMDCSGVALDKGKWDHFCLPMRFEPDHPTKSKTALGFADPRVKDGELLWPEVYTAEKVSNLEVNMGLYSAAGQLQQRPSPRGGGKFKRAWFDVRPSCPPLVRVVRYWDKAGSEDGQGARSAGALVAQWTDENAGLRTMRDKFIILDIVVGRWEAAQREAVIKQVAHVDRHNHGFVETWVEQEPGSGGKESAQSTVANLAGFSCQAERVTGDKVVRADPLASQASVGKVSLLAGPWNLDFLNEIEQFPLGKLKDQVDAAGGAFNKLWSAEGGARSANDFRAGSAPGAGGLVIRPERVTF